LDQHGQQLAVGFLRLVPRLGSEVASGGDDKLINFSASGPTTQKANAEDGLSMTGLALAMEGARMTAANEQVPAVLQQVVGATLNNWPDSRAEILGLVQQSTPHRNHLFGYLSLSRLRIIRGALAL
jgi:hypothetical protein